MFICALDVGGTKTVAAVAEYSEKSGFIKSLDILGKKTFPTGAPSNTFHRTAAECVKIIAGILIENGLGPSDMKAAGISAPGMVDSHGKLVFSPVTGWRDVDTCGVFRSAWAEVCGPGAAALPVSAECDVNACALAEVLSSGSGDMLWVTVSTGIGGACVTGGKVLPGYHSVAGEIGHVKVEYDSPRLCSCGQYGCAEAHASGTAVGKMASERAAADKSWADLFRTRSLGYTAENCSLLAAEGDGRAVALFEQAGDYLGRALANAINLLDPAVVYIGGGMARSFGLLERSVRRRIESDAVFMHRGIPVLPTALGYDASLLGAFALACRTVKDI